MFIIDNVYVVSLLYVNAYDGKDLFSFEIIILNPGIEFMVCTTPSMVQDYIYVYKFNSTINHWVGTGLGLVYIPHIVYNM